MMDAIGKLARIALMVACALVLSACGSDDGGAAQQPAAGQGGMQPTLMSAVPNPAGAPTGACCADGNCLCRGPEPTTASASAMGPFGYESYTEGFRDGPSFLAGTIYYPTDAEPPFAGVVLCPGFTAATECPRCR